MKKVLIGVLAALVIAPAQAGLRLAPILVELGPEARDATVNVTNTENNEIGVAVWLEHWTQTPGLEIVRSNEPVKAVRVFPPQMTLSGEGAKKIVRLIARDLSPGSYRLVFKETTKVGGADGVKTLFEASMPVFVGQGKGKPVLEGAAQRTPEGVLVTLTNTGNRYAVVRSLTDAKGRDGSKAFRYILPGFSQQRLIQNLVAGPLTITLDTGDKFVVAIP